MAAALVGALVLTGCGDTGDDEAPAKTPAPSASSDAGDSPIPSSSPEAEESTSTVAPATGEELTTSLASLRVPQGWYVDADLESAPIARDRDRPIYVSLSEDEDVFGQRQGVMSLQELAENSRSVVPQPHQVEILDEVTLDGVDFYHLSGPDPYSWLEEYGVSHEGMDVLVSFEFPKKMRPQARERIVDSVLATFEWR